MKAKIFKVGFWIMLPLLIISIVGNVLQQYTIRNFLVPQLRDAQNELQIADSILIANESKAVIEVKESPKIPSSKTTIQDVEKNYQLIKTGMSLDQVTKLIGNSYKELSRSEYEGYSEIVRQWETESAGTILIIFMNGKVMTKGQS